MFRNRSHIKDRAFKTVIAIVALMLWLTIDFRDAFLWTVFLLWWAFRLDARILGGIAIAFLVAIPIAQSFGADAKAEQLAVYVYFLMVMVVTLQIIEYRRESRGEAGRERAMDAALPRVHQVSFQPKPVNMRPLSVGSMGGLPIESRRPIRHRKLDL